MCSKSISILGVLTALLLSFSSANAATKTWVAAAAGNWSTPANWSGGAIPLTGDDVVFDGTSTKNCTLDIQIGPGQVNTGLNSLSFNAGFTGTFSQGANALTITGTGLTISSGTYTQGAAALTINGGGLTVSGGLFTQGAGGLSFGAGTTGLSVSSGTYNQNAQALTIANGGITVSGGAYTQGNAALTISAGGLTVSGGTFTEGTTAITINGGGLTVSGGTFTQGSGGITFGAGTTGLSVTAGTYNQNAQALTIAVGGLNISGTGTYTQGNATLTISIGGLTMTGGTFTEGTSAITINGGGLTVSGGTFNQGSGGVTFGAAASGLTVSGGTYAQGNNTLTIANGGLSISSGTFTQGSGLITVTLGGLTYSGGTFNQGAGGITVNGGALTVSGGTFTQGGTVTTASNSTGIVVSGGIFNQGANTLTSTTGGITVSGGTFNQGNAFTVTANGISVSSGTFNQNNTITVTAGGINVSGSGRYSQGGTLTITAGGLTLSSGTFAQGAANMTVTAGGVTMTGGTLDGTTAGTAASTMTISAGAFSLTGGTFNAAPANITSKATTWTVQGGTFNGGSGTVIFAATTTITGSHTLNNCTFNDSATGTASTYTIAAGTILSVNGTLILSSGGPNNAGDAINTGTINALGDVTVLDSGGGISGTAILQIGGSGTQTLTGSGSATLGTLPPVNIAKPSGTLTLASTLRTTNNWTYTSGTINPGTSTVVFAASLTVSGSHTLGNVTFNDSLPLTNSTYTITAGTVLSVNGTLTLSSGGVNTFADVINTGTINALGDVTVADAGGGMGGSAILQIGGGGNQTLTGGGSSTLGNLPTVNISKPSGTLTLASTIRTASNWTYTSGTINPAASTVAFGGTLTISGSHTLGNVTFNDSLPLTASTFTITAGTVLSVNGTLTLSSGGVNASSDVINTGTLNALGDVTVADAGGGMGGTAILQFGGNGTQTLTGGGSALLGNLPPVNIAKPSGTLNLASTIRTASNWTYTSGAINPGSSTVVFAASLTITGSHTLGNVTFNDSLPLSTTTYTINAGTVLSVNGTLTISSGGANVSADVINTGTLNALGDVILSDAGGGIGGSATLQFGGSGSQTFTGGGSATLGSLPAVTIAKPSGTLTLASTIRAINRWTYISGTINPGSSTVAFAATLTITGSHTLGNVIFNDSLPGTGTTYTIAAGTVLSVNGTLSFSSGGAFSSGDAINTGTLNALGDVVLPDSGGGIGGSAILQFGGSANQMLTGSGSIYLGNLPPVNIAKTGGTLTLSSIIRTASNWSFTSGTINAGTSTVVFAGTLSITGSHTLGNVLFNDDQPSVNSVYTISAGTVLSVNGTLTLSSGGANTFSDTINTGTLNALADVTIADVAGGIGGSAILQFGGSAGQTFTGGGSSSLGDLPQVNIAKTGGTLTLASTIRTTANWTYTSGTLNPGASTVAFAGVQTISGSHTLGTVLFNGLAGTYTFGNATTLSVSGLLTMSGGHFAQAAPPATGSVAALANVVVSPTWSSGDTATLAFAGAGDQTFDLTGAISRFGGSVLINKSGGATQLLSGFIGAANQSVHVQSGTLDLNGNPLSAAGPFSVDNGATLQLHGDEAVTVPTLNSGSTVVYVGNGVSTQFTLMNAAYSHLQLNSAGSSDIYKLPAALSVTGNLTIARGVLDSTSSNFGLTVSGNWTVNATGSFNARSGVVTFVDATKASTLTGSASFHNLTCATNLKTLQFAAGSTQTVGGTLNLAGSSGNLVTLRSTVSGSQWSINPQGSRFVQYVDVKDSINLSAGAINPLGSLNSGNNTNWFNNLQANPSAAPLVVGLGSSSNLSCAPSGGSGTYSTFAWSGPGGFSSTAQNPGAVTPPALGNNVYTVTVTDLLGAQYTSSITISILPPIVTNATAAPATIQLGASTTLSCNPSGGSGTFSTYAWSGPGGFVSSVQIPGAIVPAATGNLTYTLVVTDSAGLTATTNLTVTVINALKANPAAAPLTVALGSSIALSSAPSGGSGFYTAFAWSGPGGFTSTLQNPGAITAPTLGSNVYTLTTTDSLGFQATSSVTISVLTPIVVNAMAAPASVPLGSSSILSCNLSGGTGTYSTYAWSGPGGFVSSLQNPGTVTPASIGNAVYSLTVTDSAGLSATASVTVAVTQTTSSGGGGGSPIVVNPAASQTTIKQGSSITLLGNVSGGTGIYAAFSWSSPGGFTSTQRNPGSISPAVGTTVYTLTVTDSAGTQGSGSVAINVLPNSPPVQLSPLTATPVSTGSSTMNFATQWSDPENDPLTYQWNFGDGAVTGPLSSSSLLHTYAANGTYNVTVTVSDGTVSASSTLSVVIGSAASVATSAPMHLSAKLVHLVFDPKRPAARSIVLKGSVSLADGLNAGQPIHALLQFGNVSSDDMALSSKGRFQNSNTKFSIVWKTKNSNVLPGSATFSLALKGSELAADLDATGFVNADKQTTLTVPVTLNISGQTFQTSASFNYSASANQMGVGR